MTGSPLCEPASPQLDSDRRGRSYVLSWMLVASETHADRSERPRPVGALLQENASVRERTRSPACRPAFLQVGQASVRTGSSKDDRKRVDGGISGDEPAALPAVGQLWPTGRSSGGRWGNRPRTSRGRRSPP